jgi:Zn-finger nucleic acid-binding protein
MVEARAYQCPVCGAFARDGERSCRHCSTVLATLRCARCFELNFPDDLHCRGCGQELGLEPVGENSQLTCPDCKLALHEFSAGSGTLHACERCGGQMVTHGLLRALLEERETLGNAVPSGFALARGNPLLKPVRYRSCPACGQMMNRKNFGGTSGIVVDVCAGHGSFFDAGELPRVLEFVRRGGLAHTRATPEAASLARASEPGGFDPLSRTHEHGIFQGFGVVDLFTFIVDVLHGAKK